jgi:hypothetical protein
MLRDRNDECFVEPEIYPPAIPIMKYEQPPRLKYFPEHEYYNSDIYYCFSDRLWNV